jgi:DNA (cytosine-5)-methyltransferase 1
MGYARAGFEVVGIDLNPQKRYPFEFHQGNALGLIHKLLWENDFDAIHASPPCQAYSITKHTHGVEHPDLLGPTRELLQATGLPYIIENVVGADMPRAVICCGSELCFDTLDDDGTTLFLKRHRQFESNVPLKGSGCVCIESET